MEPCLSMGVYGTRLWRRDMTFLPDWQLFICKCCFLLIHEERHGSNLNVATGSMKPEA